MMSFKKWDIVELYSEVEMYTLSDYLLTNYDMNNLNDKRSEAVIVKTSDRKDFYWVKWLNSSNRMDEIHKDRIANLLFNNVSINKKSELKSLIEQAELVKSIAWQYAHPFQEVEEWNEWREIHDFSENVLNVLRRD